ncbi:hypothetical protein CW304_29830 [Bacillus sp. UFRGS-B20]|nr:hypothetical protein CW304_29830 [Bacillus sp. UFRGS-B20]
MFFRKLQKNLYLAECFQVTWASLKFCHFCRLTIVILTSLIGLAIVCYLAFGCTAALSSMAFLGIILVFSCNCQVLLAVKNSGGKTTGFLKSGLDVKIGLANCGKHSSTCEDWSSTSDYFLEPVNFVIMSNESLNPCQFFSRIMTRNLITGIGIWTVTTDYFSESWSHSLNYGIRSLSPLGIFSDCDEFIVETGFALWGHSYNTCKETGNYTCRLNHIISLSLRL